MEEKRKAKILIILYYCFGCSIFFIIAFQVFHSFRILFHLFKILIILLIYITIFSFCYVYSFFLDYLG